MKGNHNKYNEVRLVVSRVCNSRVRGYRPHSLFTSYYLKNNNVNGYTSTLSTRSICCEC